MRQNNSVSIEKSGYNISFQVEAVPKRPDELGSSPANKEDRNKGAYTSYFTLT